MLLQRLLLIFTIQVTLSLTLDLRNAYPRWTPSLPGESVGEPLILTPYIQSGKIQEAQQLSSVTAEPFANYQTSYSGYLTVNEEYNSNLFFWYFPAQNNEEDSPLLLWLQGGPGASSMFGLFTEIGPFSVDANLSLIDNEFTWNYNYSLLFIDSPVGTGFSFTENEAGYARNQTQIGGDLYNALIQFLTLFPDLQERPFFITGESYAGKYIPSLGYTIYKNNPDADLKINLQGLAIGDGYTDPASTLFLGEYLYQLSLVDDDTKDKIIKYEDLTREALDREDFHQAQNLSNIIEDIFENASDNINSYNFLQQNTDDPLEGLYSKFLQTDEVRTAIHVGNQEFSNGDVVHDHLYDEIMTTVKPWVEELLNNGYRIIFYNGQLDIVCAYPLSVHMFRSLEFIHREEYLKATRYSWYVDDELAGYIKKAGNFAEVLVRASGHMVPTDQPKWALNLIHKIVTDTL